MAGQDVWIAGWGVQGWVTGRFPGSLTQSHKDQNLLIPTVPVGAAPRPPDSDPWQAHSPRTTHGIRFPHAFRPHQP